MSLFVQQEQTINSFTDSGSWVVLSPIEQSIKQKIEAVGKPLKDWDIQINYGIKTGFNDAFIINEESRAEILSNCLTEEERKRTAELIRPILRGRDIKRYGYNWAGLYLIATFPSRHYNIDDYPALKSFLLSFGVERLEQTGKKHVVNGEVIKARKKTNNKWFETQDSISYWEDFSKPKVIYMEIQTDNPQMGYPFPCFSYDNNKCVVLNTAYIMCSRTVDTRIILATLNSSLGKILTKFYVTQLQQRQFRMLAQYVTNFPIAKPSESQAKQLIDLVEKQLRNYSNSTDEEINQMVFDIYGLTEEERKYVSALL